MSVAQIEIRKPGKGASRRRIQVEGETVDGMALYRIKSRSNAEAVYHPVVDVVTGCVQCDCPHHQYRMTYRRLGHQPTVADAAVLCHHLQRAINEALRKDRFDREEL